MRERVSRRHPAKPGLSGELWAGALDGCELVVGVVVEGLWMVVVVGKVGSATKLMSRRHAEVGVGGWVVTELLNS